MIRVPESSDVVTGYAPVTRHFRSLPRHSSRRSHVTCCRFPRENGGQASNQRVTLRSLSSDVAATRAPRARAPPPGRRPPHVAAAGRPAAWAPPELVHEPAPRLSSTERYSCFIGFTDSRGSRFALRAGSRGGAILAALALPTDEGLKFGFAASNGAAERRGEWRIAVLDVGADDSVRRMGRR